MPIVSFKAGAEFIGQPGVRLIGNRVLVPRAGLGAQLRNGTAALGRLVNATVRGRPLLVSPEVEAARRAVCWSCDFWEPFGLLAGQCTHRGCGCSAFKLKFATERCPLRKWGAEMPPEQEKRRGGPPGASLSG